MEDSFASQVKDPLAAQIQSVAVLQEQAGSRDKMAFWINVKSGLMLDRKYLTLT